MTGIIFSVKRYAIHDGPGIRVTFFMKGCPLSCWWCHNPEGISAEPEEVLRSNMIGAREFKIKEMVGKSYSIEDILEILEKDRVFIDNSDGGVTFSGGEPLMQFEFLHEALQACKAAGFHTAIDTSGYGRWSQLEKILPVTDLILYDVKHLNPVVHKKYTGKSNILIMSNLKKLLERDVDLMIRIPVVPGINDDAIHMEELRTFIKENKTDRITMINLLPYHKIGSSKYKRFNRNNRMGSTGQISTEKIGEIKQFFMETGIEVKIGG
jgi:pyruvate formate lyase activating enzyme